MPGVQLRSVSKRFGDVLAVASTDLDVRDGEFFSLLGPSGCGKTTLLRMVAGFTAPSEGSVHFGDRDVTGVLPEKRNVGMVFQNYALFPNRTVAGNVAFGLEVRGAERDERQSRVARVLEMVGLENLADRAVTDLSGGEQQRVALARAIVIEPDILLLDEPLSNLDARLRVETRAEIRRIQQELGITAIYVTHDQEEALSVSDRIAVMEKGRVLQVGPPAEVYHRPSSRVVGEFLGRGTFIDVIVEALSDGVARCRVEGMEGLNGIDGLIPASDYPKGLRVGTRAVLLIRPEDVEVTKDGAKAREDAWRTKGKVLSMEYLGAHVRVEIACGGLTLQALAPGRIGTGLEVGGEVAASVSADAIRVVEIQS